MFVLKKNEYFNKSHYFGMECDQAMCLRKSGIFFADALVLSFDMRFVQTRNLVQA